LKQSSGGGEGSGGLTGDQSRTEGEHCGFICSSITMLFVNCD
jgi:hypothetical protein